MMSLPSKLPPSKSGAIPGCFFKWIDNNRVNTYVNITALPYGIKTNVIKAFTAGCDLVLHCNANLKEMYIVAENSPKLSKFIIKITNKYYKLVSNGESKFNW